MKLPMTILTVGQCAKMCGVSNRTIRQWVDSGRLKGYQMPGSKHRRVLAGNLLTFMTEYGLPIPDELKNMEPNNEV